MRAPSWLMVLLAFMTSHAPEQAPRRATYDEGLRAQIVARRPLYYAEGADPEVDRPPHVRAASGIAWIGRWLAAIQDDANFVALVEPATGRASAIPLPEGPDGKRLFDDSRGTKQFKLDLEACFARRAGHETTLFAFGSGTKPLRERIAIVSFEEVEPQLLNVRLVEAAAFYRVLHDAHAFSGSELNVEGAVLRDDTLLLFQRGNGAARDGRSAQNAIAELSWSSLERYLDADGDASLTPSLRRIERYDLGDIEGIPLTFTDATLTADGSLLFLASAEASPDSVSDGQVHGARIGEIDRDGNVRIGLLLDEQGRASRVKAEGIVVDRQDPSRLFLVVDMDDPALASELLEVRLR